MSALLAEIGPRLALLEERLERLLAGGWRTSAPDRADLMTEATELDQLGLTELASRLRAVAAAETPAAALPALTLAIAAGRLLRTRLPLSPLPDEGWQSLVDSKNATSAGLELLLPVCRVVVAGEAGWACVRARAAAAHDWVLVTPPTNLASAHETIAAPAPWLWRLFRARLRWRQRVLLGANGEVEWCEAVDADWRVPDEKLTDPTEQFRKRARENNLLGDYPILRNGGALMGEKLDPAAVDDYLWLDPVERATFLQVAGRHPVWTITWRIGSTSAPLAILKPGGMLQSAKVVHLVSGAPTDQLLA